MVAINDNHNWQISFHQDAGPKIPKGLWGQNLEITRHTMFGGLSAQLINNRKFFSKEAESFARGWEPIGNCVMAENDPHRLPEIQLGETPGGILQKAETLRLRPKVEYRWRLCLKGEFQAQIRVALGSVADEVLCKSNGDVTIVEGNLFTQKEEIGGSFSVVAVGNGRMKVQNVSLLPADAVLCGLRPDVIAKLRTLQPHSMRFPGGCYAEFYDWKQGLLPQDERNVISVEGMDFILGPTWGQDPMDMNLDDYVSLCRMVGANPEFTVGLSHSTPEDAVALLEYANGDETTHWGAIRAARGHKEPYGIKRWYIGNEIVWCCPGLDDPLEAARKTVEYAKAMKKADPTIELVPSNWVLCDWNSAFMKEMERLGGAELLSRASYHQYLLDLMGDYEDIWVVDKPQDPSSPERIEECLRAPVERILPRIRAVRQELETAGTRCGALPITMDEWNYYWGRVGHPILALYVMGLFHVLIRHGAEFDIREALFFHPINEGLLHVSGDDVTLEDGAHAWRLSQAHAGRHLLTVENPQPDHPCDVAASKKDNSIYITLVNRTLDKEGNIRIPELAHAKTVRVECWRMMDEKDAFRAGSMEPYPIKIEEGGSFVIPPASLAGIWYEAAVNE